MPPNDGLTDHFLKATSVSAVFADAAGQIGVSDVVGIDCPAGRVMFCCISGRQHEIADRARSLLTLSNDQTSAIAAIRKAAADLLIGLTSHETVVVRARAAVAKVERTIDDMQKSGGLKAMNREFKAARAAGLASSYSGFIHAKKIALLEAMVAGRR